jgi:predicted MFS family arabinose efflux permease
MWGLVHSVIPLLIVFVPLCLAMATSNTVMTSSLSKAVSVEEIGGILGLAAGVLAITRALGAPLVGVMIQYGGLWLPGVAAGAITLAVVPYIWWVFHRPDIPVTITECGDELAAEGACAGEDAPEA